MAIEQVEKAYREAVERSNGCFDRRDFKGSEQWHWRAVALYELLHGPQDSQG